MFVPPSPQALERAAALLRAGKLVAFPTETVYGLGADATNERAVAAIFEAKGRPQFNPLIVHVAAPEEARAFVQWSELAEKLAARFWPGPLTLVLPRTPACAAPACAAPACAAPHSPIALLVSAGLDSLAVRCPAHPLARDLIRRAGVPVAAPSANASGRISPTQAEHVRASLGNKVDMILDGGACEVGVESTVLDLTSLPPTLLRHGGVTREMLEAFLGAPVREALHDETAPKSPGMSLSHYAPAIPVRLNVTQAREDEAFLIFGAPESYAGGATQENLSPSGDLLEAAANLFSMMRAMDQPCYAGLAVAPIPMQGLGVAINDRLRRAATL